MFTQPSAFKRCAKAERKKRRKQRTAVLETQCWSKSQCIRGEHACRRGHARQKKLKLNPGTSLQPVAPVNSSLVALGTQYSVPLLPPLILHEAGWKKRPHEVKTVCAVDTFTRSRRTCNKPRQRVSVVRFDGKIGQVHLQFENESNK